MFPMAKIKREVEKSNERSKEKKKRTQRENEEEEARKERGDRPECKVNCYNCQWLFVNLILTIVFQLGTRV